MFKPSFAIILCFLLSGIAFAKPKDIYFEIHNDALRSSLTSQKLIKKNDHFYCEVYWTPEQLSVVPVSKTGDSRVKDLLEKSCENKSRLIFPESINTYLKGFAKAGGSDGWDNYLDASGVDERNEILIKQSSSSTRLIEKRPTGTTRISYRYRRIRGRKRLDKATIISYEGIQNVTSDIKLKYKGYRGYYFPFLAKIDSSQNLVRKEIGDHSRKLTETVYFKNYQVNKGKAKNYFKNQLNNKK